MTTTRWPPHAAAAFASHRQRRRDRRRRRWAAFVWCPHVSAPLSPPPALACCSLCLPFCFAANYGAISPILQRGRFAVIPEEPQAGSPALSTPPPGGSSQRRSPSPEWDFDIEQVSGSRNRSKYAVMPAERGWDWGLWPEGEGGCRQRLHCGIFIDSFALTKFSMELNSHSPEGNSAGGWHTWRVRKRKNKKQFYESPLASCENDDKKYVKIVYLIANYHNYCGNYCWHAAHCARQFSNDKQFGAIACWLESSLLYDLCARHLATLRVLRIAWWSQCTVKPCKLQWRREFSVLNIIYYINIFGI